MQIRGIIISSKNKQYIAIIINYVNIIYISLSLINIYYQDLIINKGSILTLKKLEDLKNIIPYIMLYKKFKI